MAQTLPLILGRKKVEGQRSDRSSPCPTMESKGDDVLSNASDALEKDQTLIPTLNQDHEGEGEGKKARPEADADYGGTIGLLFDEIRALNIEKRELKLRLDDARKELHRTRDNLTASAAAASKDFEAEADRLKGALKDLEAEKAKLAVANDVLEAEISTLEERLLADVEWKEVDDLALRLRADLLKMKVLGLSENLWHSMEQAEAIVKGRVEIREVREEVLEQAVMALKETKTRLERELAGILSQINRHLEIQGEHDASVAAMSSGLKVSWVVAAVASVGALAAMAVTVCLRNIRQR